MKVTCLAVGDPHFRVDNVEDAKDLVQKVNLLVDQLQPTFVVILGDLLHTHERVHTKPLKLATELITSLACKAPVYLIIGNHDYCLAKDIPVLMWNGDTKLSQNVQIGDQLVGDDNTPRTVTKLMRGIAPMYTITQEVGCTYRVTGNHTLSLKCTDDSTLDITVNDYMAMPKNVRNNFYGYRSDNSLTSITITQNNLEEFYGWELDDNHRFLLGDLTVTHNCNQSQFLSDNHAFNSFKEIDNVTICDNVIIDKIGNMKFVFCPYTPPERFEEALNTVEEKGGKWDDATCIFAHQEFYGCRFNPTKVSTNGDIWPEEYPLVVSGHIHDEQWLQDNIYYTGSSIQHSYAENSKKTIALLTFAPKKKVQVQKIDLEMRKRKIIYLDIEKVEDFKPPTGNVHIKLTLLGTPEQFKIFRKSKTFKKLHALGLAISFNPKKPNHQLPTTLETQRQPLFDILEDLIKDDNEYVQEAYQELVSD